MPLLVLGLPAAAGPGVDMYAGGIPQTLGFDQMSAGQAAVQQREAEMMRRALALSMQPAAGRDGDPGGRLVVARTY